MKRRKKSTPLTERILFPPVKIGLRAIDDTADAMVSPVDATISAMCAVNAGTMLSVKGQDYTLSERSPNHREWKTTSTVMHLYCI